MYFWMTKLGKVDLFLFTSNLLEVRCSKFEVDCSELVPGSDVGTLEFCLRRRLYE